MIPKLTQNKMLDRETLGKSIDLTMIASNNCNEKPDIESISEESKLEVRINIEDINDVAPKFVESTVFESISIDDSNDWSRKVSVSLLFFY